MDIGSLIKDAREKRGLSQRQLSLLSGISNSEISRIEAGERKNPSPDVLKVLAKPLGLAYEDLMTAAGYLSTAATNDPAQRISQAIEDDTELIEFWKQVQKRESLKLLFKQVKDLDDESIKKIVRVIKAIEDEEAE